MLRNRRQEIENKKRKKKYNYYWKAKWLPSASWRVPRSTIKQTSNSQQVVLLVDTWKESERVTDPWNLSLLLRLYSWPGSGGQNIEIFSWISITAKSIQLPITVAIFYFVSVQVDKLAKMRSPSRKRSDLYTHVQFTWPNCSFYTFFYTLFFCKKGRVKFRL